MPDLLESPYDYDLSGKITSTGSANAYVITQARQINGYYQGFSVKFKANFGNTGAATANVATQSAPSGLGAVNLRKAGGAAALASGDIVSGGIYTLVHDGTNFQVLELNAAPLAAGSVGTTQLADDGVTNAKLANMAQLTIKARKTLSTGDPEDCTLSEVLDFITSAAQGDILYRGAASWARLGAGTSGQFLQTQGAGANPQWALGGSTLLASNTVSASATLDLVLTSYTGYRALKFVLSEWLPATDGVSLQIRTSTNGGSSYDAGASDYAYATYRLGPGGSVSTTGSATSTSILLATSTNNVGNASNEGVHSEVTLAGQTNTAFYGRVWATSAMLDTGSTLQIVTSSGVRVAAGDIDAVRFLFSSGNIASGKYAIYGLS